MLQLMLGMNLICIGSCCPGCGLYIQRVFYSSRHCYIYQYFHLATSYLWNFGDPASGANNTSTAVNPTHFYQTLAPYLTNTIVKLTATGPGGTAVDSAIYRSYPAYRRL